MNRRRLEAEKKRPKKKRKRRRRRRRRSRKGTKRKQKKKPTSGERCKRSHYLVVIKQTTHRLNDNIMKIMAPSTSSGRFYGLLATSKIHNTKKNKNKNKNKQNNRSLFQPVPEVPEECFGSRLGLDCGFDGLKKGFHWVFLGSQWVTQWV